MDPIKIKAKRAALELKWTQRAEKAKRRATDPLIKESDPQRQRTLSIHDLPTPDHHIVKHDVRVRIPDLDPTYLPAVPTREDTTTIPPSPLEIRSTSKGKGSGCSSQDVALIPMTDIKPCLAAPPKSTFEGKTIGELVKSREFVPVIDSLLDYHHFVAKELDESYKLKQEARRLEKVIESLFGKLNEKDDASQKTDELIFMKDALLAQKEKHLESTRATLREKNDKIKEQKTEIENLKISKLKLSTQLESANDEVRAKERVDEEAKSNAEELLTTLGRTVRKVKGLENQCKALEDNADANLNFMFYEFWKHNPTANFASVSNPKVAMDCIREWWVAEGNTLEEMPSLEPFERLIGDGGGDLAGSDKEGESSQWIWARVPRQVRGRSLTNPRVVTQLG